MEVPHEWQSVLRTVQQYCPEAVIAGGCLRDLDNGREIKDIDIFIRGSSAGSLENLHARMSDEMGAAQLEPIDSDNWYPVGDGNDVVGHFEAAFTGCEYPVQIIMIDFDTSRICERFDFGICRISYDGTTLTITDEYQQDKADKLFKLRRQRNDLEMVASVHRFARLSRKYEGWHFALFDSDEDDFDF